MRAFSRNTAALLACCWLLCSCSTSAEIIVSIDNISLTAGGPSGFANVWVHWDNNGGLAPPSINVDNFSGKLNIVSPGGAGSAVHFRSYFDAGAGVNHNGDHHFFAPYADDYLFHNNSLDINSGVHAGSVSGTNDTIFSGGDFRNDVLTDVVLEGMPRLLFRLELYATGVASGAEVFSLQFAAEPDSIFYENDGVTTIPFSLSSFGSQGQITVTGGGTAVPEPGCGIALLVGAGFWGWRRRKRMLQTHHSE